MAVEVAGEHPVKRGVVERQGNRVGLHERGLGDPLAGDLDHPVALVEPRHGSGEVAGEETRAAGDIERPRRR